MKKDIFNSYLHIDTARLRANIDGIIASLPEGTQLIPVLKCNAYGFGVGKVAGIMNGFCYLGSTISAYGLGSFADAFGWESVFTLLFSGII